ncbi:MAG: DUF1761 domain-containing protein [Saprospiraceae bacterium]|nr:DUF1761 domain-containing protein [Saprospiraceae bacterium]
MNTYVLMFLTALVPLLIGFMYYHPKTLANVWMREAGLDEEKLKGGNMGRIFGLTYLFSFMLAFFLQSLVIHQFHLNSIIMAEPGFGDATSAAMMDVKAFMDKYGDNYRTFGHGALHGFITSIFFVLPVIGINALFERRSWKYIAIHWGFWAISLLLMGGIICANTQLT